MTHLLIQLRFTDLWESLIILPDNLGILPLNFGTNETCCSIRVLVIKHSMPCVPLLNATFWRYLTVIGAWHSRWRRCLRHLGLIRSLLSLIGPWYWTIHYWMILKMSFSLRALWTTKLWHVLDSPSVYAWARFSMTYSLTRVNWSSIGTTIIKAEVSSDCVLLQNLSFKILFHNIAKIWCIFTFCSGLFDRLLDNRLSKRLHVMMVLRFKRGCLLIKQ